MNEELKKKMWILLYIYFFYKQFQFNTFTKMENDQEAKNCCNCQRSFPITKIDLHEAYCCRNFRKCEFCGVMIDRNYLQEHQREFHSEKQCEYCKRKYLPQEEEQHALTCLERPEHCLYCENSYPASSIDSHKEACGARTKKCVLCGNYIMLKEIDAHLVRCTNRRERRENSQNQRQPPRESAQQLYRQNSSNNIQLNKPKENSYKDILIPKPNKVKGANIIGPQIVSKALDPIPIGVKLAMQKKQAHKNNEMKKKKIFDRQNSSSEKKRSPNFPQY